MVYRGWLPIQSLATMIVTLLLLGSFDWKHSDNSSSGRRQHGMNYAANAFQSHRNSVMRTLKKLSPPSSLQRRKAAAASFQEESNNIPFRFQSIMSAAYPRLDNWSLLDTGNIVGTVSNHPSIDDGDIITTSPIADPDTAGRQTVVQTLSGTYYKLLEPSVKQAELMNGKAQQEQVVSAAMSLQQSFNSMNIFSFAKTKMRPPPEQRTQEWIDARMKYKLRLDTVGLQDEYLLAGKPVRSTSGKSKIWDAYRSDPDNKGLPTSDPPVCIKVSTNIEAVSREYDNYCKIRKLGPKRGPFVLCHDFFPVAGYTDRLRTHCALVIEKGAQDLKSYLNEAGNLEGDELRNACTNAARCLQSLHSAGLVWTDLKTENFVVMGDGEVRGIDLESAMPVGDNPVDYSPEACPPEFAAAFLSGDAPYFQLDFSYDVWSLGMFMFELVTGRGAFDGKNPAQITKILRDVPNPVPIDEFEIDEELKEVIVRCLNQDPLDRPSIKEILRYPYFGLPKEASFFDFFKP